MIFFKGLGQYVVIESSSVDSGVLDCGDGLVYKDGGLKVEVSISEDVASFRLSKEDGSTFSGSCNDIQIRPSVCNFGPDHILTEDNDDIDLVGLTYKEWDINTKDLPIQKGETKDFYLVFENMTSSCEQHNDRSLFWVGPVTIKWEILPTISITYPTSSTIWESGSTQTVTWNTSDLPEDQVFLVGALDGLDTLGRVYFRDFLLADEMSYDFTVPEIEQTNNDITVVVAYVEDPVTLESNIIAKDEIHRVTIEAAPEQSISIINPTSESIWEIDNPYDITWETENIDSDERVVISIFNGNETFALPSILNEGSLAYTPTLDDFPEPTTRARLSIRLFQDASITTDSDLFEVVLSEERYINVTTPSTWEAGEREKITWETNIEDDRIEIEVYKANSLVYIIDEDARNDGDRNHSIADDTEPGTDYSIRVVGLDSQVEGFSDEFEVICDDPSAAFDVSDNSVEVGERVNFTDESSEGSGEIDEWRWDFDDGNTSEDDNPSHIYTRAGIYNVTLTVTNTCGESDDTKRTVEVSDPAPPTCTIPTASFLASRQVADINETITFTDGSNAGSNDEAISSWDWDFGDGGTSTLSNPNHSYSDHGTYEVILTVTNDCDESDTSDPLTITITEECTNPTARASFSPSTPQAGQEIAFQGDLSDDGGCPGLTYRWDFGDGTAIDTRQNPEHTYEADGDYEVTLTVTNSEGLTDNTTINIPVICVAPTATIFATPNPVNEKVFVGQDIRLSYGLSDEVSVSVLTNHNGSILSYGDPVNVSYDRPGTYSVTVAATYCGSNIAQQVGSFAFTIHAPEEAATGHEVGLTTQISQAGDPVNLSTGDYDLTLQDMTIQTREGAMPFLRRYLSTHAQDSSCLGFGWTHSYNLSLVNDSTLITIVLGDGSRLYYNPNDTDENDRYAPYNSFEIRTLEQVDYEYHLQNPISGMVTVFSLTGQWNKTLYPSGYEMVPTYTDDKLTFIDFQNGRSLSFVYDGEYLDYVEDNAARRVDYGIDEQGDLIQITSIRGFDGAYSYEDHFMITATDYRGTFFMTNEYDSLGRVTQQDWLGDLYVFEYDTPKDGATTLTDPDGTHIYYHDDFGRTIKYINPLGHVSESSFEQTSHASDTVVSPRGEAMYFENDAVGNPTRITLANSAEMTAQYDDEHLPESTLNALDQQTVYEWTDQRKLESITFADTSSIQYSYYDNGQLKTITDQEEIVYTYVWDGADIDFITTPTGTIDFTFNEAGQLTAMTDRNDRTYSYAHDAYGNLTEITYPSGNSIERSYDENGNVTGVKDLNGEWTYYDYNDRDFVTSITDREEHETTITYNQKDRVDRISDEEGNFISYTYDELGRVTAITDNWGTVTQDFDENNNLVSFIDAESNETSQVYNALNRLSQINFADQQSVTIQYDTLGFYQGYTDEIGNTHSLATNEQMNWVDQVQDALGAQVAPTRNARGDIVSYTTPNNNEVTLTLNAYGLTTQMDYGEQRTYDYGYDNENNLTTTEDANGLSCTITVNELNLVTEKEYSNGNTYVYERDANGWLLSISKNGVTTNTFQRDKEGRITYYKDAFDNEYRYVYNSIGQRTSLQVNDLPEISYEYDRGLLSRVSYSSFAVWYSYSHSKQLTSISRRNAINTRFTYDSRNRIDTLLHEDVFDSVFHSHVFSYNERGEITSDEGTKALSLSIPRNTISNNFERGTDDRLTSQAGNEITSDLNGNVTAFQAYNLTWGEENILESYTKYDSIIIDNIYDGLLNRVAKTQGDSTIRYLIDPTGIGTVIGEQDGDGNILAFYIHSPQQGLAFRIKDNSPLYYHFDQVGNTVALSDGSGSITDTYAFNAFGDDFNLDENHQGETRQPFQFSGQFGLIKDDYDLYWVRKRWLKPSSNEFLSKDAYPASLVEPQTVNRYAYALNDPLGYVDPTGLNAQDKVDGGGKVVSSAIYGAGTNYMTFGNYSGLDVTFSNNYLENLSITAESISKNSKKTRLGSNGSIYFENSNGKVFHGNSYIKTLPINQIARNADELLGPLSNAVDIYNIGVAFSNDNYTFGENTQLATVRTAGSFVGGWTGFKAGSTIGALYGLWFGPAGAVIGGVVGGIYGGITGSLIGEMQAEKVLINNKIY